MQRLTKVFVFGYFDILHAGHLEFLRSAAELGNYLIVCLVDDVTYFKKRGHRPALPLDHRVMLLKSLPMVNEVIIADGIEEGLEFKENLTKTKPQMFAVTENDEYISQKGKICTEFGIQFMIIAKDTQYSKLSSEEIRDKICAPSYSPLRIDICGQKLDLQGNAKKDGLIINCAITPLISLHEFPYERGGDLGEIIAEAMLGGVCTNAVGWQDKAVINETGLCVWQSGPKPLLKHKTTPLFLTGKMALFWTGKVFSQEDATTNDETIIKAGQAAMAGVLNSDLKKLCEAVNLVHIQQLAHGFESLEPSGEMAKKYVGFGGYALYIFHATDKRNKFVEITKGAMSIEPYTKI